MQTSATKEPAEQVPFAGPLKEVVIMDVNPSIIEEIVVRVERAQSADILIRSYELVKLKGRQLSINYSKHWVIVYASYPNEEGRHIIGLFPAKKVVSVDVIRNGDLDYRTGRST